MEKLPEQKSYATRLDELEKERAEIIASTGQTEGQADVGLSVDSPFGDIDEETEKAIYRMAVRNSALKTEVPKFLEGLLKEARKQETDEERQYRYATYGSWVVYTLLTVVGVIGKLMGEGVATEPD